MDSARLIINNIDLSTSTTEVTTSVSGFTVVKAPKGPITPIRISSNSSAKLQDIFGVPSKEYTDLYEAYTFNEGYDTYISAPYGSAKVPVAYVTSKGVFASDTLMPYDETVEKVVFGESEAEDVISVPETASLLIPSDNCDLIGKTGNNKKTTVNWNATDSCLEIVVPYPLNDSDSLRISNLPFNYDSHNYLDVTVTDTKDSAGNYSIAVGDVTIGSYKLEGKDTIIKLTGDSSKGSDDVLSATAFQKTLSEVANYKNITVYVKEIVTSDDVYAVIFPKYPSERKLYIDFTAYSNTSSYKSSTVYGKNLLKMNVWEDGAFHDASKPVSITGSLDEEAKDSYGAYMGFNSLNASYNQELIHVAVLKAFKSTDEFSGISISKIPSVVLEGGSRSLNDDIYEIGWKKALDEEYSSVNLFFDPCYHEVMENNAPALSDSFKKIGETHTLAGCIFNATVVDPDDLNSELMIENGGERYWSISNKATVELAKTGSKFASSLVGARALMQARIIRNRFGGVAPMYINSGSPAMGGQLSPMKGSSFVRLAYKYNKAQQMKMDEYNYNPVIGDRSYGVMVVGQKTCKGGDITDWSYIGHVSAFLDFQREVRDNVMIPQLGKANNPYYRELRKQQVENILAKRLSGNNRIWAAGIVDTSTAEGVNDAAALRARKFIIDVKVKVDVFSEWVVLNFTNVDQGTTL